MQVYIYTFELCKIVFSLGPFPNAIAMAREAVSQDMNNGEHSATICAPLNSTAHLHSVYNSVYNVPCMIMYGIHMIMCMPYMIMCML